MARALTSRNLLEKKTGQPVKVSNAVLAKVLGAAVAKKCWLIYGIEKNGKTALALEIAKALAPNTTVDYISAEEGTEASFQQACLRAGINKATKIKWSEYLPLTDLVEKYKKPKSSKVIIIDNCTIYSDEFKDLKLLDLLDALKNKLVIFLAHEERKEPFPAVARMIKKLSTVYFHVQGLKVDTVSRFEGGGGSFLINKEKAELYWGEEDLDEI
jgi:hypothetical protein